MTASAVRVAPDEVERGWRQRIVSLVINGKGTSSDLAPRFPCALPPGLGCRFASVSFRADLCVLALYLDAHEPAALLADLAARLRARRWELEVDEAVRFIARNPIGTPTAALEVELLPEGLRVAWCLDEDEMDWLLHERALTERAGETRRSRRGVR